MDLQKLTRPNVWQLKPYFCARNEFQGEASVYLDANESRGHPTIVIPIASSK